MTSEKKIQIISIMAIILVGIAIAGEVYVLYMVKSNAAQTQLSLENMQLESQAKLEITQNMILQTQEEFQKKIDGITKALERVEKESKIKLTELEEEVKNVNIQSGDFSAILEDVFPGVVNIATDKGRGSGAIITEDGYIVTNYHVIRDARVIQVVGYNKRIYNALPIGAHVDYDIAVIKINGTNFKDLSFANSDKVKVGEHVVAVGNPAGLGFSVTEGIISQVNRVIGPREPPMIQTDVPINPGNSGGPLINTKGNIVGINRLKIAGFESLGFAIPSNVVNPIVEEIIKQTES